MSTEIDYLSMPDDEIAKVNAPEAAPAVPGAVTTTGGDEPLVVDPGSSNDGAPAPVVVDPVVVDPVVVDPVVVDPAQPAAVTDPQAAAAGGDAPGKGDKDGGELKPVVAPVVPASQDATAFTADLVKRLQAGIKANGKTLQINNADEAEKLIQMGAGFTKKMQELAPALRIVKMLSNNELLDEGKISYLIDLSQKNPAAIQKLLVDSKFDPLTADKAQADDYIPGDHQVSDTEVQFQNELDNLIESEEGTKFLQEIQGQWDRESKQALLKEPSIISSLNHQRSNGIYQVITNEIDRLSALGQIPVGTPFLQAYKGIGDMLQAQGKLVPNGTITNTETPAAKTTQVQAPAAVTPPVNRGPSDAARDAAPVKATTTKPANAVPEFLALSDEEFLKQARV